VIFNISIVNYILFFEANNKRLEMLFCVVKIPVNAVKFHLICRIWQLLALKSVGVTQLCAVSRIREANVSALPVVLLLALNLHANPQRSRTGTFASLSQFYTYRLQRCAK
jgi:hypothetical protein